MFMLNQDFKTNNPFVYFSEGQDITYVIAQTEKLSMINKNVSKTIDIFKYDGVHFAVPIEQYWKISKKLQDSNRRTGMLDD